ncbi:MAG: hypothetical protein P1U37_15390 [Minwuia sp.]|nr:hypothetical protein [Minwuia sp.]
MTFHLTAESVASATARAYLEGRLGFQRPGWPSLAFNDDGFVNVIGAALPDDIAKAADKLADRHIFRLREAGLVTFSDDDNPKLQILQHWYDFACEGVALREQDPAARLLEYVSNLLPDREKVQRAA